LCPDASRRGDRPALLPRSSVPGQSPRPVVAGSGWQVHSGRVGSGAVTPVHDQAHLGTPKQLRGGLGLGSSVHASFWAEVTRVSSARVMALLPLPRDRRALVVCDSFAQIYGRPTIGSVEAEHLSGARSTCPGPTVSEVSSPPVLGSPTHRSPAVETSNGNRPARPTGCSSAGLTWRPYPPLCRARETNRGPLPDTLDSRARRRTEPALPSGRLHSRARASPCVRPRDDLPGNAELRTSSSDACATDDETLST